MLKVVWPDVEDERTSEYPAEPLADKEHILLGIVLQTLLDQPVDDDHWLARDAASRS